MTVRKNIAPPTPSSSHLEAGRGLFDLRRGLAIGIKDENGSLLVLAAETLNDDALHMAREAFGPRVEILVSDRRADALAVPTRGRKAVRLILSDLFTAANIMAVADPSLDLEDPLQGPYETPSDGDNNRERAALEACRLANFLPVAVIAHVSDAECGAFLERTGGLVLSAEALLNYGGEENKTLTLVSRTPVPLLDAHDAEVALFRPASGRAEHIAVIIGKPAPNKPALVRIHSECFTGDLLASLKCDCGDQLRGAISKISDDGGGVLIYLAQEGRGIGLPSKIKAYKLQEQGFDTVDANLKLGFEADERAFEAAARILEHLCFTRIRLLTNNPEKMAALAEFNIEVVERVAHDFPANIHNQQYLKTKKNKSGHLL